MNGQVTKGQVQSRLWWIDISVDIGGSTVSVVLREICVAFDRDRVRLERVMPETGRSRGAGTARIK